MPGASPALAALAASRAADEALPHSPQLLQQLAAPSSSAAATNQATALTTVRGIDVASYQHQNGAAISWASVARAGYKFAAIKTTEGDYYVNPYAISDIVSAKSAGLYATVYHFAIPNITSGAARRSSRVKYSGYRSGGRALPLMLDIEYDPYVSTDHTNECYGLSGAAMRTWISSFVSTARSADRAVPHHLHHGELVGHLHRSSSTAFGADPMWVAAYGFSSPPMPAGWRLDVLAVHQRAARCPGWAPPAAPTSDTSTRAVVGLIDPGQPGEHVRGAKVGLHGRLRWTATGQGDAEVHGIRAAAGPAVTASPGDITGTIKKGTAGAVKTYRVDRHRRRTPRAATASATFSWQVTGWRRRSAPRRLRLRDRAARIRARSSAFAARSVRASTIAAQPGPPQRPPWRGRRLLRQRVRHAERRRELLDGRPVRRAEHAARTTPCERRLAPALSKIPPPSLLTTTTHRSGRGSPGPIASPGASCSSDRSPISANAIAPGCAAACASAAPAAVENGPVDPAGAPARDHADVRRAAA